MKKVLIVFCVCFVIALLAFYLWSNPDLGESIGNSITNFFDNLIEGKYVEYDSNLKINDLSVTNNDFYFKTLTEDQKKMYTAVALAVKNMEQVAKVKGYVNNVDDDIVKDASVAMEAFFADHPEAFYVNIEYEVFTVKSVFGKDIEIKVKYTSDDKSVIKEQINTLKQKVDSIISSLSATTDIEKEIELHDKLCESIEYYSYTDIKSIPVDKHSAYGALIKNSAVCDGISKAMQILLDRCGIDNILVIGKIDEAHAWNLVKLDGEWYNLDLTSDKSIKSDAKYVIHSYFNITTLEIEKTHTIENKEVLPLAIDKSYNYYVYKDLCIKKTDNFSNKLKSIVDNNKNPKILEFSVEDGISDVPDKLITTLQKNNDTEYLTENLTKISYYNILNSYIIRKIL